MNSTYRSLRNDKTGNQPSPDALFTTGNAGFALKGLAVSLMLAFTLPAHALPTDGVVAAGGATISGGAGSTTITQSTQNVAINWQSFNIGVGEAVQFVQPNSSSVALNRVLGPDPSSILGSMSANGKVFLVNPNGILFGAGSQINVSGLVASTLNISDSDFMAGKYMFSGSSTAAVTNRGTITAADGGFVALLGAEVSNEGVIIARLGSVALAAGSATTLDVAGDGLLNVTVNQGAVNALAQNGGLIQADGGNVLLTALAAGTLLQSAVNNTGVIQAQTIENHKGTIRLMGDMAIGTTNVSGTLDASAPNGGDGGFIETSAAHVNIADDIKVTTAAPMGQTGTWLIDPVDFVIQAGFNISGAALSAQLVNTDITITTVAGPGPGQGDINVNEAVVWNGALGAAGTTTLTLNALNDTNINAVITATRGNLVVCCGRDINVNALITTTGVVATPNTGGNVLLSAGRDVNIVRAADSVPLPDKDLTGITTTSGNILICAGRDINLSNTFDAATLITLTNSVAASSPPTGPVTPRGMTLIAGAAATGPGVAGGGTLKMTGGPNLITVTGPGVISPINITYNPTSYTAPTNYSGFFTGTGGPVNQSMLVFPGGANKVFDGTTTATFTSFQPDINGLVPGGGAMTLAGGIANYDTALAGAGKLITYSGFTLGGASAGFALPVPCCGMVTRTTGTILPAPPGIPLIDTTPVETPDYTAEEMMGFQGGILAAQPLRDLMPNIEMAGLPPQLQRLTPIVPPAPPPVLEKEELPPPVYVPPVRPPKQDRN